MLERLAFCSPIRGPDEHPDERHLTKSTLDSNATLLAQESAAEISRGRSKCNRLALRTLRSLDMTDITELSRAGGSPGLRLFLVVPSAPT